MRVILDTNVLIAALISPIGAPQKIYCAWREKRFEVVTCELQLDELRRVSRYPKLREILPAHRVGTMINHLRRGVIIETLPKLPAEIRIADKTDEFLLVMAIAAGADYLISGDKRAGLLELGSVGRTRILTPNQFCKETL